MCRWCSWRIFSLSLSLSLSLNNHLQFSEGIEVSSPLEDNKDPLLCSLFVPFLKISTTFVKIHDKNVWENNVKVHTFLCRITHLSSVVVRLSLL